MLRLFESEGLVGLGFVLYDIFIFFTKKGIRRGGGGGGGTGGGGEQVPLVYIYSFVYYIELFCRILLL